MTNNSFFELIQVVSQANKVLTERSGATNAAAATAHPVLTRDEYAKMHHFSTNANESENSETATGGASVLYIAKDACTIPPTLVAIVALGSETLSEFPSTTDENDVIDAEMRALCPPRPIPADPEGTLSKLSFPIVPLGQLLEKSGIHVEISTENMPLIPPPAPGVRILMSETIANTPTFLVSLWYVEKTVGWTLRSQKQNPMSICFSHSYSKCSGRSGTDPRTCHQLHVARYFVTAIRQRFVHPRQRFFSRTIKASVPQNLHVLLSSQMPNNQPMLMHYFEFSALDVEPTQGFLVYDQNFQTWLEQDHVVAKIGLRVPLFALPKLTLCEAFSIHKRCPEGNACMSIHVKLSFAQARDAHISSALSAVENMSYLEATKILAQAKRQEEAAASGSTTPQDAGHGRDHRLAATHLVAHPHTAYPPPPPPPSHHFPSAFSSPMPQQNPFWQVAMPPQQTVPHQAAPTMLQYPIYQPHHQHAAPLYQPQQPPMLHPYPQTHTPPSPPQTPLQQSQLMYWIPGAQTPPTQPISTDPGMFYQPQTMQGGAQSSPYVSQPVYLLYSPTPGQHQ